MLSRFGVGFEFFTGFSSQSHIGFQKAKLGSYFYPFPFAKKMRNYLFY